MDSSSSESLTAFRRAERAARAFPCDEFICHDDGDGQKNNNKKRNKNFRQQQRSANASASSEQQRAAPFAVLDPTSGRLQVAETETTTAATFHRIGSLFSTVFTHSSGESSTTSTASPLNALHEVTTSSWRRFALEHEPEDTAKHDADLETSMSDPSSRQQTSRPGSLGNGIWLLSSPAFHEPVSTDTSSSCSDPSSRLSDSSGFVLWRGALSDATQRELLLACLREYSEPPNTTNLDATEGPLRLPLPEETGEASNVIKVSDMTQEETSSIDRSLAIVERWQHIQSRLSLWRSGLFSRAAEEAAEGLMDDDTASSSSSSSQPPRKRKKSEHVDQTLPLVGTTNNNSATPLDSAGKLFSRISWITLGFQYDWTLRQYDNRQFVRFPRDLGQLVVDAADQVRRVVAQCSNVVGADIVENLVRAMHVVPEAGIINFYGSRHKVLGGHVDDAEDTMDHPVVSISLGAPALFLLGTDKKEDKPVCVVLRSGDIAFMAGKSRVSVHAVPRVFLGDQAGALPQFSADAAWRAHGKDLDPKERLAASNFAHQNRININARQVRASTAPWSTQQSDVSLAGSRIVQVQRRTLRSCADVSQLVDDVALDPNVAPDVFCVIAEDPQVLSSCFRDLAVLGYACLATHVRHSQSDARVCGLLWKAQTCCFIDVEALPLDGTHPVSSNVHLQHHVTRNTFRVRTTEENDGEEGVSFIIEAVTGDAAVHRQHATQSTSVVWN